MNPLQLRLQLSQRVPLAEDVVVVVVSAVAVTGSVGLVLVLCTGGAPSDSDSGNLTRLRSATACVVVPGVISWLVAAGAAVVAVAGSSGGLTCTLGIGPFLMGSRSLRTFNGLPRGTGVGFHGSQIMAFKRVVSQRRLSTRRFNARLRTMPFGVPIKSSSVLLSRWSSARNCLSNEQDWVWVRRVSNLLVCSCR